MMKECPECGVRCPDKHFMVYGVPKAKCRVCRKREQSKINSKAAYARNKGKLKRARVMAKSAQVALRKAVAFDKRSGLLVGPTAAEATRLGTIKRRNKFLKTRFNVVTSVTRQRLRTMRFNPSPTGKTLRAIDARQKLLDKYIAAYQTQLKMVEAGVLPPDIIAMVNA